MASSSSADCDSLAVVLSTLTVTSTSSPASASASSSSAIVTISQDRATTFPLFNKMPLELRNQVWVNTIPGGQQITLEHVGYIKGTCDDATYCEWLQKNMAQVPAALFVNKESRAEVSRVLTKINCKNSVPFNLAGVRPIYTSHADLCTVQFTTLLYDAGTFHDWLEVSEPALLSQVTKLEVRDTIALAFLHSVFISNCLVNLGNPADFRNLYCGSFMLFPALKQITFTGKAREVNWGGFGAKSGTKKFEEFIVWFLDARKAAFNDNIAPKVIFRQYVPIQESLMA